MEFGGNRSLKGHKGEIAPLSSEQWLVTCIFFALLITKLDFPLNSTQSMHYITICHKIPVFYTQHKTSYHQKQTNTNASGAEQPQQWVTHILQNSAKRTDQVMGKANEGELRNESILNINISVMVLYIIKKKKKKHFNIQ